MSKTHLITSSHELWQPSCNMIEARYRDCYGAAISITAKEMVVVTKDGHTPIAAGGVRCETDGFFSDSYLCGGIVPHLSKQAGMAITQSDLIEVVTLSSIKSGAFFPLIDAVISLGRERGKTWGVFTATSQIRSIMQRAGIPFVDLGAALPQRISNPQAWGRYYETSPRVCALYDYNASLKFNPRQEVANLGSHEVQNASGF